MRNKLLCLGFALVLNSSNLFAQVDINFTSPALQTATTSSGTLLSPSFTFSLGSFGSFTPNSLNLSDWASNFTVVPQGAVAWDDGLKQFSGVVKLTSNAGVFATTNKAYIWGYNSQIITPGVTEWVLFTNNSWSFPVSTAPDPVFWDVNDSGTTAVFGTISGTLFSNPYIQTALVAAVPEPSTYAALFGAAAVAMVWVRRRRQAVA